MVKGGIRPSTGYVVGPKRTSTGRHVMLYIQLYNMYSFVPSQQLLALSLARNHIALLENRRCRRDPAHPETSSNLSPHIAEPDQSPPLKSAYSFFRPPVKAIYRAEVDAISLFWKRVYLPTAASHSPAVRTRAGPVLYIDLKGSKRMTACCQRSSL